MSTPNTLAERLRYAREKRRLSARALSRRAHISAAMVGLIERGTTDDPKGSTIKALAAALGVTTDWLLTGEGDGPTADEEPARKAAA